jgi:glycosyltransferase involved in cell wall biosynthesis
LLVSRSVGLFAFYRDFARYAAQRWPGDIPGTRLGQFMRSRSDARLHSDARSSIEACDVAFFLTDDEVEWARRELGPSSRWVALPNGLTDAHATRLAELIRPAAERLREAEVSFIGTWDLRKGAADWPAIVERIRTRVPRARFLLLGTGCTPPELDEPGIRFVPRFSPAELPELLATPAVGLMPSYTEGWGLGLLEQLAAGIPTVAYDVSGPRTILSPIDARLLAPRGDVSTIADSVADVLELPHDRYDALAQRCVAVADRFRWSDIAHRTSELYRERLDRLTR